MVWSSGALRVLFMAPGHKPGTGLAGDDPGRPPSSNFESFKVVHRSTGTRIAIVRGKCVIGSDLMPGCKHLKNPHFRSLVTHASDTNAFFNTAAGKPPLGKPNSSCLSCEIEPQEL